MGILDTLPPIAVTGSTSIMPKQHEPSPGDSGQQANSQQTVRAGGLLLLTQTDPRQFLLLRHPDRWDLPKGHCELGESFLDAALRELTEETGIPKSAVELDPDFCFELQYPVRYKKRGNQVLTKQLRYFLGYLAHVPELTLTEHQDSRWFPWRPPHQIQPQTIDPLLAAVAKHIA